MTAPQFHLLNDGWNAEPNAPSPHVDMSGADLILGFYLNFQQFARFAGWERGFLRFLECSRFRFNAVNMDGWYFGQCRYSKIAPQWGEFYELTGDDEISDHSGPWTTVEGGRGLRHFLLYFRDETFECFANDWGYAPDPGNALFRAFG